MYFKKIMLLSEIVLQLQMRAPWYSQNFLLSIKFIVKSYSVEFYCDVVILY